MATVFTRRIIALILDFFVVSSIMWIFAYVLSLILSNPYDFYDIYKNTVYVVPFIILIYFTVLEKIKGATVGKAVMYLGVLDYRGYKLTWGQALVRNLSKIYWVPVIFDWAIGHILKKRDRILDIITRTKVIDISNIY